MENLSPRKMTDHASSTLVSDLVSEFQSNSVVRAADGSHVVKPEVDAHVLQCASGGGGARNRWFDKALSVFVETSGRAGMMGEHSP